MAAADAGKAEKQRIDSKPMVENKAGAEAPKEKSRKGLILAGSLIFVLALGGVAFFAYVHFFKGNKKIEAPKEIAITEQVKDTLALEPFLVNLADQDETHFAKTTFQLGLGEKAGEETKNSVAIAAIRDSIISLLSSKRAEQILSTQGKDELRKEIRTRVNQLSPKLKVVEVFIVDFVVQL